MVKFKVIRAAYLKSLPVSLAYIIIGAAFGMMLKNAGYGPLWALIMSIGIYAGSMQFVGVSLISGPASYLMTFLTTIMINARHLFYSVSMISKFEDAKKFKPYLIFSLTDETYALLADENYEDEDNKYLYYFLISLFNHISWILGGLLGNLIEVPFNTEGVSFAMTALFLVSFTDLWIEGKNRLFAGIGLIVSLLARIVFTSDNFLIPAMIGISLCILALKDKNIGQKYPRGKDNE